MAAVNGNENRRGHLFTVEILIEETTNGLAMERLLNLLNTDKVKDYRIKSGIELGKLIELNVNDAIANSELAKTEPEHKKETAKKQHPAAQHESKATNKPIIDQLEKFKQENTLIRLIVVKGKGIKLNLPCRILNFDPATENVTVYHVDEKKVYLFKLNEIDDFVAG